MEFARPLKPLYALRIAALLAALACGAQTASTHYIDVDLVHILAPPPLPDSKEGKADLAAVFAAQANRTDAEIKSARADAEQSVFRFGQCHGARIHAREPAFRDGLFQERAFRRRAIGRDGEIIF